MVNHPNRSKRQAGSIPTGESLKALRQKLKLSQTNAAKIIHCSCRTWQQWEKGDRKMHPAFWELFQLKVKQTQK